MNPRILIIAVVAILVLVLVGVGGYFYIAGQQAPDEPTEAELLATRDTDGDGHMDAKELEAGTPIDDPTRFPGSHKRVLVAKQDIPSSTLLRGDMFTTREVAARGEAPDASVLESDANRVYGRISSSDIHGGDFVVEGMVYGGAPQLSYLVPKYKRAISIRYDELSAVSGLIELGDLVDAIGFFNLRPEVGGEVEYSKILVQNARIIAKGRLFIPKDPSDTSPPPPVTGLTVAVYPHEAEELVWAENYRGGGNLRLALRAPVNDVFARTSGVTERSVFGRGMLKVPNKVEMYAGTGRGIEVQFEPVNNDRIGLPRTAGQGI